MAQLAPLAARQGCADLQPRRWVYLRYAHQIVQAALAGQGLALTRLPLVAEALADGRLVEVFPRQRPGFPADLLAADRPAQLPARPEVRAFAQWLQQQARRARPWRWRVIRRARPAFPGGG